MKSTRKARSTARETQNLTVRYGEIGISAVAAAVCYRAETKHEADKQADKQKDFALAFDRD